ncbi:lipase [Alishewanella longhuensis]|uniref:Lipase n=1 Tax=Alishewanella longhuensis TaxID=1091037 RepID=A0ABQ3KX06_9ALTE|nr:VolA/Pla-1 family phospholipase [Alishewanella longhuensis]GHG63313.1 lipase [Alishewanella longhuensis]
MKKFALTPLFIGLLGLTACGGSNNDSTVSPQPAPRVNARVVFDPEVGKISLPNDVLFIGSKDGTLTPDDTGQVDYSQPHFAMGALDGWSTISPFKLQFEIASGVQLDKASTQFPGAVRLFQVALANQSNSAECPQLAVGAACQLIKELVVNRDFAIVTSERDISIVPLRPLQPGSSYLLSLSSALKDSRGFAVAESIAYSQVRHPPGVVALPPQQARIQALINSYERLLELSAGQRREDIIYTAAFSTQDPTVVLKTVQRLLVTDLETTQSPSLVVTTERGLVANHLYPNQQIGENASDPRFYAKLARVYRAQVKLPYYSALPSEQNPLAPLQQPWTARCDNSLIVAAQQNLPSQPVSDNDFVCHALSYGKLRDLGLDQTRHLTRYNDIPKINQLQTLQVQLTLPNQDYGITKPANGWPVVILQHGIGLQKEVWLQLAAKLAAQGYATVAIDLPLHGSRGFGELTATISNGGDPNNFLNPQHLLVSRDNLQQSIADTLGLRMALNFAQGVELDVNQVHYVGHSSGAIVGSAVVALANNPELPLQGPNQFLLRTASLLMPGAGLGDLVLDSDVFGPRNTASLLVGAYPELRQDFMSYVTQNGSCDPYDPANAAEYLNCAQMHVEDYLEQLEFSNINRLRQVNTLLDNFRFAARNVLNNVDPVNFAAPLLASNTPIYLAMISGSHDGTEPADEIFPSGNSDREAALERCRLNLTSCASPLSGAEALSQLLQSTAVKRAPATQLFNGPATARFIEGDHFSIVSPEASNRVTMELQQHLSSYIENNGTKLYVLHETVLKDQ